MDEFRKCRILPTVLARASHFTIGDSGKVLDPLNLAPYGSNILTPINYGNFIGYDSKGNPLFNYNINASSIEAPSLDPYKLAKPTSTGVSGYYTYSISNWPEGSGYKPGVNPASIELESEEVDPVTAQKKLFRLNQPTYLSYLSSSQSDLSGLYGFGSGAAQVDVGDSYLMVHYKSAQPIDPAIALIGRSQGVTQFDADSLFYRQWSPRTARLEDLGLFSFDIDESGSLTNVLLVQKGNGYFESDLEGSSYLTTDQDFEILGNNPTSPLGSSSSDPSRAVVRLSFSKGQLVKVMLVRKGSGYEQLSNAIRQNNINGTTITDQNDPKTGRPINNSLLVGINIDLEAQYTLAASHPYGSDPYQDWYLITNTGLASTQATAGGAFGSVSLSLEARSQAAQDILTSTPITTGYSGEGPQNKLLAPSQGALWLIDAIGNTVGQASVANGRAAVSLQALPAPGR
jgi:hypothetical protein